MVVETTSLKADLLLLIFFKVINREDAFSVSIVESKIKLTILFSRLEKNLLDPTIKTDLIKSAYMKKSFPKKSPPRRLLVLMINVNPLLRR